MTCAGGRATGTAEAAGWEPLAAARRLHTRLARDCAFVPKPLGRALEAAVMRGRDTASGPGRDELAARVCRRLYAAA